MQRADWKQSARFLFEDRGRLRSGVGVRTKAGRWTLVVMLVLSAAFAVWAWMRPYDGEPDPRAKAGIVGVELRRDHSFHWLTVHVRADKGEPLELSHPPHLRMGDGRELQPADTRLAGNPESGFREAWFKFWLESGDLEQTLELALGNGRLTVKSRRGIPDLKHGSTRHFSTHRW